MTLFVISFLVIFGQDSLPNANRKCHLPFVMDTINIKYLLPCKWSCSCDWNVVHYGWLIEYKGKQYHWEGKRKDGNKNNTKITDFTE